MSGVPAEGEAEARITDEGISVGPVSVEFLDADLLVDEDRVLALGLYPEGTLRLFHLGRRHQTFAAALAAARDGARLAGMLAHGLSAPVRFSGTLREPGGPVPARLLIYATHLAVVPDAADPFQLPFGSFDEITFDEAAWEVRIDTAGQSFVFGQLARQTEAFARALSKAWEDQKRRFSKASGTSSFADGLAVPATELAGFGGLLERFTASERIEGARLLVELAGREQVGLGLVELLDPDTDGLAAAVPLPHNMAAFLIASIGDLTVLEVLSGPSAATYVFRGRGEALGRDLQALHFRRGPLALSEAELAGPASRPYRLALRRLEPLRRLRAATVARVVHGTGWEAALRRALSPA
ncbi:MAG: hypothetical protein IT186_00855 [Acidobacteria bacterium]|nr:hypothetical protein [Acidobacteriota bacterium]